MQRDITCLNSILLGNLVFALKRSRGQHWLSEKKLNSDRLSENGPLPVYNVGSSHLLGAESDFYGSVGFYALTPVKLKKNHYCKS